MADMQDKGTTRETFDLAVIGAGPAGMTSALYAARAGLSCAVFERLSPGGQLAQTEHLENYPGYTQSTSGFDLAMQMYEQAASFGAHFISEEVVSVDFTGAPKLIDTAFGAYAARAVIVATGARPAKLGLAREDELAGHGVSYCATCDGNFFRGRDVVVVGGGNTAAADAIYLSRICGKVYVVHRRDRLRATAIYHQRLADLENVEFVWNAEVSEIVAPAGKVEGVRVRDKVTGEVRDIECAALFVAVGTRPNTEFLAGALQLDETGYVRADELGATATPGVYAAGDVRTKALRQVVTAVSDGANCAEAAAEFLSE
ncbi:MULTISPECIES: thioredoxin-disulfide reductase [unclassified Adlercreutzia]|uniref:thioredoxin-disulfide reductase n=1 Tax=unclassified Adlercreutzia TaxID=2636013 RepID=UPI0019811AD9|nr:MULTISPECIES: thioredoxin-disulfide reductase [unclassified Adlercreutzia]